MALMEPSCQWGPGSSPSSWHWPRCLQAFISSLSLWNGDSDICWPDPPYSELVKSQMEVAFLMRNACSQEWSYHHFGTETKKRYQTDVPPHMENPAVWKEALWTLPNQGPSCHNSHVEMSAERTVNSTNVWFTCKQVFAFFFLESFLKVLKGGLILSNFRGAVSFLYYLT